ncbi:GNAT family N-acetyltransferase [Allopontixanthobacter sp.]|uniref:GNAT family N-acetyltransferase n=1 Tax=Allopontixanthobacter sp. TaxID=2906452 RepID=UPI002ABA5E56|nr:GNAT family N-acetyltransferase [Allopontixanthobacter sp.]MDZ4308456.1 GNAT family N-acetyltransferase [Allopontixanthobacter sp.]
MADFRLETERLILRDFTSEGDWEAFFRVTNTPAVMEWLGGLLDDAGLAMQRARVEQCAAAHGHCFWLVERKPDGGHLAGEALGFCGLKRADAPGSTATGEMEIGWRLREDAWGAGYAREAAEASLRAGFDDFGAAQIIAITVVDNRPSWGLMIRLGMRRREDLDYPDTRFDPPWRDHIVYSISREEWEMQR